MEAAAGLETAKSAMTKEGVHWSKDFVEHLRTVHFALMTVSVGLVALALAHPIGRLGKALKQIQEIEKVFELDKRRPDHTVGENYSDWVGEWAEAQVKQATTADRIQEHGEVVSPELSCITPDGLRQYYLNQEWVLIHSSDEEKLDRAFLQTELPGEGAVVKTAALGLPMDIKLEEFKRLWDFLHQHMDVVVPSSRDSRLFLWNGKHAQWDEYKCEDKKAHTRISAFLDIGLLSDAERWAKLAYRVGDEPPRYGYVSNDNTVFISLHTFSTVDFDGQGWFLSKIPTWRSGRFAESFPELDEVSAGISNQGLDTVEHVLKNRPNESAESFEAFGIKVPSAVVMRFGILLVIAVQVYFLTHLVELSKRLSPTDPGWEVAWVGVYDHVLARLVYFFTIAVLPVLSIAVLGKRGLTQLPSTESWVILVAGVVLGLWLALWIWRKTPRRTRAVDH